MGPRCPGEAAGGRSEELRLAVYVCEFEGCEGSLVICLAGLESSPLALRTV